MSRDLRERNESLIEWVRSMYGPGRQFPSARQWALHAGLSASVVNAIEESGYASCKAVIKLARAANASPTTALLLAGYLSQEECSMTNHQMSPRKQDLLHQYCQLDQDARDVVDATVRLLRERAQGRGSGYPD